MSIIMIIYYDHILNLCKEVCKSSNITILVTVGPCLPSHTFFLVHVCLSVCLPVSPSSPPQDALPPPPHYHPGRLVVHKPDLPPSYNPTPSRDPRGMSPRSSRTASVEALRDYHGRVGG